MVQTVFLLRITWQGPLEELPLALQTDVRGVSSLFPLQAVGAPIPSESSCSTDLSLAWTFASVSHLGLSPLL